MSSNDLMHFIESTPFSRRWSKLKLADDDLLALQVMLCLDGKAGSVIKGTGGLRKLRFAPPGWNRSTRDSLRICYAYFEEFHVILLLAAYSKSEKDSLSDAECAEMKSYLESIHSALAIGRYT